MRRIAVSLALILLETATVAAQTTADLYGAVSAAGVPLSGVAVSVSSRSLQGSRTTTSDGFGAWRIGALPPGEYEVRFELQGLRTEERRVYLSPTESNRLNVTMHPSPVADTVTVAASFPNPVQNNQIGTTITGALVEQLPMSRTIIATALLAPGVDDNTDNAVVRWMVSISGAPAQDNLVMVDGVSIQQVNSTNGIQSLFIEDAIQETTVLTGAISAEYGRFTGGVVSTITRSGGNELAGSLRGNLTNPAWTSRYPYYGSKLESDPAQTWEGTLGGFVLKDRLWFFTAARLDDHDDPNRTYRTNIPYTTHNVERRVEGKLTAQVHPGHAVTGTYMQSRFRGENIDYQAGYDLNTLSDSDNTTSRFAVSYDGVLANDLLIEVRYGEKGLHQTDKYGAEFTDLVNGTLFVDSVDFGRFWSPTFCGVCEEGVFSNQVVSIKGSLFHATGSWGTHNITAGGEQFTENQFNANHQSGSDFRVFTNGVVKDDDGTILIAPNGSPYPILDVDYRRSYIRWNPIVDSSRENDLETSSLFVNDRWDLTRHWSFNVGLRYDRNDSRDASGRPISDDDGFSPRLTAIFDRLGDGRERWSIGYNRYRTKIGEGPATASDTSGVPSTIDYRYGGPPINPPGTSHDSLVPTDEALRILFDWFLANGGPSNIDLLKPFGARSLAGYEFEIQRTLHTPYVDELTFGYGRQLGRSAFVRADLIYREWGDFLSFRIDETTPQKTDFLGIEHDIAIIENTDNVERTYKGVQVQSAWRPWNGVNLGANYTWSKLEGNDAQEGESPSWGGNLDPLAFYPWYYAYPNAQPRGYLNGDQRHRLRAWSSWDVPFPPAIGAINVSLLHSFDSGLPYSAVGTIDAFRYEGAPSSPAHMAKSQLFAPRYYFSGRGEYRLDDIHSTDLALNYTYRMFNVVDLFVQAELFNTFDNDAVISVESRVYTSYHGSLCRQSDGSLCARFNPFTEKPIEGVHFVKHSNFGKPWADGNFQTPRTYRFSAGIRW